MDELLALLDFWFDAGMRKHWFASTDKIDKQIRHRYRGLWERAKGGELDQYKTRADACLALCIILDQLPLNMFRGMAKSFSTEQQAVAITKYALHNELDQKISRERVAFLYMPLMHSEQRVDQDLSVALFEKAGLENNLRFAKHHRALIQEFGRFPHRNKLLGRQNTAEETLYLQSKRAFRG